MFPKSLAILFLVLTLLTSGGAVYDTATKENMTTGGKAVRIAATALNTPNAIDDFSAKSIRIAGGEENVGFGGNQDDSVTSTIKKYSAAVSILTVLAIVMLFTFFFRFFSWMIGLINPVGSEERKKLFALLIATGFFFALTQFSFAQALFEVL